MTRALIIVACIAVAALPAPLAAQTAKDSVITVVNEFFRAMATRDTAGFNRTQMADGIAYAVITRGDSVAMRQQALAASARQIAAMPDTFVERMWQPTVQVHGPIAVLWAPYDIHRNGKFQHCGVDAFTLIRGSSGWKIATVTYTVEPTGCAPSPLGPPR